ncbi:MAG: FKBP-type peptidyl-prolyl cis-trans isomerase [Prosthecobacter sp.]|jgi:FKBP-type peptidyl-prolyl cis-trans isomerase|uniref:FKBP-type peptidyl-prolyl cis-trans isomerase n=1 Tax=Prosthecobacter sp. TaxID=1965333 RepID=UPI0019D8E031|nr:FKBP-type peptidyl-prolyl cis-trans isomerase [Prosthecobacter sp.]MBE2284252.1 FKBP-type peptidyl-prolyl cis-trans isomerase [Prosthecobacter sp.]
MQPTIALLCAALAAVTVVQAQEVKPAQPAEAPATPAKVPMDKVSYFIGRNFGDQFKNQGIAIDLAALTEGIKSGMAGEKPKFSQEELMAAMQAFEGSMREKEAMRGQEAKATGDKFLAENGKKKGVTTTASGLQYEVLKAGDGPKPQATDRVNVHYHGTLIDGKVFDSSVERGMPITFGVQEVIKGWTEALQLMPVGSKWRIYIPSQLAYGEQGAGGDIGPNEALIFEVELLGIVK